MKTNHARSILKKILSSFLVFMLVLILFEAPVKASDFRGCNHALTVHTYCTNSYLLTTHPYWDSSTSSYKTCEVVRYCYHSYGQCNICGAVFESDFVVDAHMQCGQ